MNQTYKAVYFPDFPAEASQQKSLTLAFGKKANELYEYVGMVHFCTKLI
ncbi:hypothetical protein HYR99_41345 [Candidatus Poribacteria bacterium]|nr:hypothetical protein [Candidatus Poribacteria bacterium]